MALKKSARLHNNLSHTRNTVTKYGRVDLTIWWSENPHHWQDYKRLKLFCLYRSTQLKLLVRFRYSNTLSTLARICRNVQQVLLYVCEKWLSIVYILQYFLFIRYCKIYILMVKYLNILIISPVLPTYSMCVCCHHRKKTS